MSRALAPRSFRLTPLAGALALLACATACSSTTKSSSGATVREPVDTAWLQPSPTLSRDINLHALEVEVYKTQDDFVRLSDWFQSVGEPAYPKLLEMAGGSDAKARSFAMSVISAMGDPRLLPPFKEAVQLEDLKDANQRYEYARALLSMGDYEGVPILIDGLEDASEAKRALSYKKLMSALNSGIRFTPNGSEEERAAQVAEWRAWWARVDADSMLQRGDQ